MFLVEVGGVIQHPDTYTITASSIVFDAVVAAGVAINIRNFGVARNINESVTSAMLVNDSVTAAKIATGAVGSDELASNSVITAKIADDAVTYAKMQNVSATDKVLGRSTASAGNVEEITCTAAGRALLDDADVTAQRNTLELGALAIKNTIVNADIATGANIDGSKLAPLNYMPKPQTAIGVGQMLVRWAGANSAAVSSVQIGAAGSTWAYWAAEFPGGLLAANDQPGYVGVVTTATTISSSTTSRGLIMFAIRLA
jgi:hypothetical protein